jgi:CHAT domain-containing protein/tetratricopeptide (TPR) repeat protein
VRGNRFVLALLLACVLAAPVPLSFAAPADDIAALTAQIEASVNDDPTAAEATARTALDLAETEYGAEHLVVANLHRLYGDALFNQKRYAEAEPHYRAAVAVREKLLGTFNADTAVSTNDLAITLRLLNRYDEALPLYVKVLDIREKVLGPNDPNTARSTFWLARVLEQVGRQSDAATLMGAAVERASVAFGPRDATTAHWMGEHAAMVHNAGDLDAAEPIYEEAIALGAAVLDVNDDWLASARHGLANLYYATGRAAEAVPLYRLALAAREVAYGPNDVDTISSADRLSRALWGGEETAEAEALFRRVLAAREVSDGPDSIAVADVLRWVGRAASASDRKAEAEIAFKRVLAISEVKLGPTDVLTAFDLIALGQLYSGQQRFVEARPLLERAVTILSASDENRSSAVAARMALGFLERATGNVDTAVALTKQALDDTIALKGNTSRETVDIMFALGAYTRDAGDLAEADRLVSTARDLYLKLAPDSRALLRATSELGRIREQQGRLDEALALHRESYAALLARYGAESGEVQPALSDIGSVLFAKGDYADAVDSFERATAIVERMAAVDAAAAFAARTGEVEDQAIARARVFDSLVKSYFRLASPEGSAKAFLVAQRVIESEAAGALAQMAARQASGSGDLAALVRDRQDYVSRWQRSDTKLTLALAEESQDATLIAGLRYQLMEIDDLIAGIDERLARDFPGFADLQRPASLDVAAVQSRLGQNEVLLFYADTGKLGSTAAETFLWVVPQTGSAHWFRVPHATGELSAAVHEMRENMGVGAVTRGPKTLTQNNTTRRQEKVLKAASELYTALLGEAAPLIAGRDLVIVPSRALGSLPFHALISELAVNSSDRYRDARWMARDHAITILPSVSSLAAPEALVVTMPSSERTPYLAFANPLLTGRDGTDRRAFERTGCAPTSVEVADIEEQPQFGELFRGATADADAVRSLQPLPETVDEACAIAAALGAGADALHLGAAATETSLKQLSTDGTLAHTDVLHFATHGLVSGDLAGLAEPAIVLTPSDSPTANDDGLLTASEVTTLKLNADWVILSACNTASSDGGGEALSGLARAFFYAGARALMVSHWPVNSDSAVRLASGAVSALAKDPSIGRAEALRRAMVAEIERGGDAADPANWAPFIVVGAGR